jgi:hypothetical protein
VETKLVSLIYQCGIANVVSEGKRLYQGDFRGAEMFAQGMKAMGARVQVNHANVAGDVLAQSARIHPGPGSMFSESKHADGFDAAWVECELC